MAGGELWQLGDTELLDLVRESQARLDREYGKQLELLAEVLTRNLAPGLGYRSPERLLPDLLRISRAEASRRLRHADAIRQAHTVTGAPLPARLPAVAAAIGAGALGAEHVEVITRVVADLPPEVAPEQRQAAEQTLVQAAHQLDPIAVAKLGRAITARLDQDGPPPSDVELRNPVNELRWVVRSSGEVDFKGRLAAEGAALLATVLSPLAKPRPAMAGAPDPRSNTERNGDALVDALRLAATSADLPTEAGERPTLLVTITLDALREQTQPALLGDTTPIDARTARRLACDSAVIPAVLGGASEPLDIGRKTRTVPTSIRRALVLRDRGCAFPGCTVPARWCDAHHRRHWANGGSTALPNLVLLCGTHHDLIHHSQWQLRMQHGLPEFIPPAYIDPHRHPRRNPVHTSALPCRTTTPTGRGTGPAP